MFTGLYTALITPFHKDGSLNLEGFRFLIQRQIEADVDGIIILGTTAESPTLSLDEKKEIMLQARALWPKKTLLVGTGNYSTELTIQMTQLAYELGADGALIISPYYNKPSQEGLYQHYQKIASSCQIPIILYNNFPRTAVHIDLGIFERLLKIENIVGIKEASGNLSHVSEEIVIGLQKKSAFSILASDDYMTLPFYALGAHGVVSAISNLFPTKMKQFVNACHKKDFDEARELHYEFFPLFKALSLESNPIPVKAMMQMCDLPSGNPRLPLVPLSTSHQDQISRLLKEYKTL